MKPGSSGSSERSIPVSIACAGRSRIPHSSKPCRAMAANMRNRRMAASFSDCGAAMTQRRGPSCSFPSVSVIRTPSPYSRLPWWAARASVPATLASQPALATTRRSVGDSTKITTASASVVSMIAVAVSRDSSSGNIAASTRRLTMPSSASAVKAGGGDASVCSSSPRAAAASSRSRSAPSILNTAVAESRLRSAAGRDPAAAAIRPSAS